MTSSQTPLVEKKVCEIIENLKGPTSSKFLNEKNKKVLILCLKFQRFFEKFENFVLLFRRKKIRMRNLQEKIHAQRSFDET